MGRKRTVPVALAPLRPAERERAVSVGASDARRLLQQIDVERDGPEWSARGLRASRRDALLSILCDSSHAQAWVERLSTVLPLLAFQVVCSNMQLHVLQLAAAKTGKARRRVAKNILQNWSERAMSGLDRKRQAHDGSDDAAESTEQVLPPRDPAWLAKRQRRCKYRSAPSVYPAMHERSKAVVARLPWHAPGTLPQAPVVKANTRLRSIELPDVEFVSSQHGLPPIQYRGELRQLLEATERAFPSREKAPKVVLPDTAWAAVEALGGWAFITRQRIETVLKKPDRERNWLAAFQEVAVPTFWAASTCQLFVARGDGSGSTGILESTSAQQWASLMGVPVDVLHPIRRGLHAVSPARARALMGQAVDCDAARALVAAIAKRIQHDGCDFRYATLCCGLDVFGGAVWDVMQSRMCYLAAAEAVDIALVAHEAAWDRIVGQVFAQAHDPALKALLARSHLHLLVVALRCNVWSPAATRKRVGSAARDEDFERALEDSQELVASACSSRAAAVVFETSGNVEAEVMYTWWLRLQQIVRRHVEYEWGKQRICPRKLFQKLAARDRIFIVGYLKE